MARKSCTKAVYKFRFISKRSLVKLTIWGQIDQQNLSFVNNRHAYDEKMARKGRTKAIYKFRFILKRSLGKTIEFIPKKVCTGANYTTNSYTF